MIMYSKDKNQNIDWNEAVVVFERAPLGKRRREPEKLKRAFESSYAIVYVFDEDKVKLHPQSGWPQEAPLKGEFTLGKPLWGYG
jgi:hypothetical protein